MIATRTKKSTGDQSVPAKSDNRSGNPKPVANPSWQSLAFSPLSLQAQLIPGQADKVQTDRLAHVQPKLSVSQPGDALEREADRVANRAMRIPGPMAKLDRSPLILEKVRGGMKAASAYVHRKESSAGRDKRARP